MTPQKPQKPKLKKVSTAEEQKHIQGYLKTRLENFAILEEQLMSLMCLIDSKKYTPTASIEKMLGDVFSMIMCGHLLAHRVPDLQLHESVVMTSLTCMLYAGTDTGKLFDDLTNCHDLARLMISDASLYMATFDAGSRFFEILEDQNKALADMENMKRIEKELRIKQKRQSLSKAALAHRIHESENAFRRYNRLTENMAEDLQNHLNAHMAILEKITDNNEKLMDMARTSLFLLKNCRAMKDPKVVFMTGGMPAEVLTDTLLERL